MVHGDDPNRTPKRLGRYPRFVRLRDVTATSHYGSLNALPGGLLELLCSRKP